MVLSYTLKMAVAKKTFGKVKYIKKSNKMSLLC